MATPPNTGVGTRLEQTDSIWPAMRDGNYVAIGWANLGDLSFSHLLTI